MIKTAEKGCFYFVFNRVGQGRYLLNFPINLKVEETEITPDIKFFS